MSFRKGICSGIYSLLLPCMVLWTTSIHRFNEFSFKDGSCNIQVYSIVMEKN